MLAHVFGDNKLDFDIRSTCNFLDVIAAGTALKTRDLPCAVRTQSTKKEKVTELVQQASKNKWMNGYWSYVLSHFLSWQKVVIFERATQNCLFQEVFGP